MIVGFQIGLAKFLLQPGRLTSFSLRGKDLVDGHNKEDNVCLPRKQCTRSQFWLLFVFVFVDFVWVVSYIYG